MTNEMRLQGIGLVEGTEAGKIQIGDILRWNFGGLSKVVAIEFTKSGKTIICEVEYINFKGEVEYAERKMRTNRLVNIVASGNTKLLSNGTFEIIEEEAAEEVVEEFAAMNQSIHRVSYRFTNHGDYVEVMLFVQDVANDIVLVAQKEAEFTSMKAADYLLKTLQKSGNIVEICETVAYTG